MSQISLRDAASLVEKLVSERIPLQALFISFSGARVLLPGFIDSATVAKGLFISVSGPPADPECGFLNVRAFDETCAFTYGDKRELPEAMRALATEHGESCLLIRFHDPEETLALFFNA